MIELLHALQIVNYPTLPSASDLPHCIVRSGNTLYFSDGTNWLVLTTMPQEQIWLGLV